MKLQYEIVKIKIMTLASNDIMTASFDGREDLLIVENNEEE